MANAGIYKLFFKSRPADLYVGSAINLNKRITRHRHLLKKNSHKNKKIQRMYNKFGLSNMVFEVIEVIINPSILIQREQFYLDNLKPTLNILTVAGSAFGYKHSNDAKLKISCANIGRKMTPEQIERNKQANKSNKNALGAKRSDEFKQFLSEIKKRKVINKITGFIYQSIGDAAIGAGLKYSTLYAKLSGRLSNNTNLIFL